MPSWENIEDASPRASRVWFARGGVAGGGGAAAAGGGGGANKNATSSSNSEASTRAEAGDWKPLRKKDCQILNELLATLTPPPGDGTGGSTGGQAEEVSGKKKLGAYVEEGRCTATLDAEQPRRGTVTYNFVRVGKEESSRELCSSTWFLKDDSGKEPVLHPIHEDDGDEGAIEELYQRAVKASSSLGDGISSVVNESVTLSDESKVTIVKSGEKLKLVLKKKGWFGAVQNLQRGYGEYSVEGEEEEKLLGPVGNLCFVIHGIGEAFFSQMKDSQMSIIDQMNATRLDLHKKQVAEWRAACLKAQKAQDPNVPPAPRRIEVIPIEWFDRLHDSSNSLMKSLKSTTLQTIPALRAIANDVIFDVLLYLTPTFCEAVLECVTEQICDHHTNFCRIHPDFPRDNCSIIGHSLGSVITWDLLSILKDKQGDDELSRSVRGVTIATEDSTEVGYQAYANPSAADESAANKAQHGTWGPTLTKKMERTIPFVPYCTIFLGSPLGIFLTLRGAHAVFDEQRKAAIEQARLLARSSKGGGEDIKLPAASPFTLPTKSLYNIFAGSDPVAYRIEPLLLSQDLEIEDLPPPVYLTAPGKELRLHVKARQLGEEFTKALSGAGLHGHKMGSSKSSSVATKNAWSTLVDSTLTALASGASDGGLTKTKAIKAGGEVEEEEKELETEWPPTFALGNPSDPARGRVDYSFQPGVVENEYINAIMAHSSYFGNSDLIDFLVSRLSMNEDGRTSSDANEKDFPKDS